MRMAKQICARCQDKERRVIKNTGKLYAYCYDCHNELNALYLRKQRALRRYERQLVEMK